MRNPHTINWFEIPVTDLARATKFYETVMNIEMEKMEMEDMKMSIFPSQNDSEVMTVHGGLMQHKDYTPSNQGTLIYLNAGQDLAPILEKIESAGGKVRMPKTALGEHGFCATFEDTEGNRIGLHSPH